MTLAVADATTGEFERLKEFGIKAKSQGEKVTFTFQGVSKTIGKNAQEIEGYLHSIGDVQFAGAMEAQADTLNVALSNMGDSLVKAIGDSFDAIAGCDKTSDTCINKFSNITNFRSFPDVPGVDKLLTTSGTMKKSR